MIHVGLGVVHQVGVGVALNRLPGPEQVSGASRDALWDNNGRVRFSGPEEVAAAGVPGRRFRFLGFPGPQEVAATSGALLELGRRSLVVVFVETSSGPV